MLNKEKSLRPDFDLADVPATHVLGQFADEPEDQVANKNPALLWQRRDAQVGDTSDKDRDTDIDVEASGDILRRSAAGAVSQERLAEQSDNATFRAMNTKLRVLAYEMHAAGKKLDWALALANSPDKDTTKRTVRTINSIVQNLNDLTRETSKQLQDLDAHKDEKWMYLTEGGASLKGAFDEFEPAINSVDAWLRARGELTPFDEFRGRLNILVEGVTPNNGRLAAKPLTKVEKAEGFVHLESVSAHLDAAVTAAHSVRGGNRRHASRMVLHMKEIAVLMKDHQGLPAGLKPRIDALIKLTDQIIKENPYLRDSLNESRDPIRNLQ